MAKIVEEHILLKFSKIVKENDKNTDFIDEDIQASIEQVAQEIVGTGILVEVMKA